MNDADRIFFERLNKEAKKDPFIRVQAAAAETAGLLKRSCTDENRMVRGDLWLYLLSVLAGISCARTGAANDKRLLAENLDNPQYMPLVKLESEAGIFYIGDAINIYLFNDTYSVWNVFSTLYLGTHKGAELPDIGRIVEKNASEMGKKGHRLWDGMHDPYEERTDAMNTYENIERHLEPFCIKKDQMPAVYGIAIAQTMSEVEGIFPKNLNCAEMVLETIVFNAHMDYMTGGSNEI